MNSDHQPLECGKSISRSGENGKISKMKNHVREAHFWICCSILHNN